MNRPQDFLARRDKDTSYKPFYAVWELTLGCDQSCHHCGSRAGVKRPNELSTSESRDLVRQLAELGIREITLIGGESYLREDWLEIIGAIKSHGILPSIVTGGGGLTAERAHAASAAGLGSASVSIDGKPETHDRLRGQKGSYLRAYQALINLREANIPTAVNTQINRFSMFDLTDVFEMVVETGARSWQVQLTVPMGRAADMPEMLLQPYDLLELFPILGDLTQKSRDRGINLVCGNNIGYFGPYDSLLHKNSAEGHSLSCGAGTFTIGIEADGTIKGCPSLATESWAGGNVRSSPLRTLWEQTEPLRYHRDRTTADLWGFCRTCYYAEKCLGGCTWMSDSLLGRPGNNPYCHHRTLELQERGVRERIQRTQPAPGKSFDRATFEVIEENWPAEGPLNVMPSSMPKM